MGVPKFYRWISERYPCLSQVVKDHQIPEFDNLYLDMNGIIHPCSHPNDDDPHFRKTEAEIFADIFHYIEVLFRIIKPQKVFFMAVDGVAPRAKMNQQRGRRFRSAREAEDNIRKALEKGQVLPKEERFDSNCITPGTPFMVRLHEQLKYFVNLKISTDPAWQGIRVYLSGHETPGEGEHKVMEFIRAEKAKPDYDSNTRHCLYGLDADLIMLGLTTHEPHFSLLREEVKFGKAAKRISKPEQITFHLLHLSLLREYLDWEFSPLKERVTFPYDLEKIIDDWILMGFLVGNDFIPHLPHLHINHDALPYLWKVYIEVMPKLDGYLHDGGILSCARFEKYMEALSKFDRDKFEEVYVDLKWLESRSATEAGVETPKRKSQGQASFHDSPVTLENSFSSLDSMTSRFEQFKLDSRSQRALPGKRSARRQELEKYMEDNGIEEEDGNTFEIEFHLNKNHYYKDKMGYETVDGEVFAEQTREYVKGIQWILHYYFNGVQSWGWYYPFHYAPYMTDIRNFSDMKIEFRMGKPFMPFEQLLAVLPAASRKLLPEPFQNLMIMEQSPIIDYYPVDFKTDLNGKQQEWEAVVLIPFIDEKRLLAAMEPLYPRLTDEEKTRNRHSPGHLYTYNPDLSFFYPSTLPETFSDILCCHASCAEVPRETFHVDIADLRKGLCEGVKLDVYFPGFPTMFHIPHTGELRKANVKVFQMHSKSKSLLLRITEQPEQATIQHAETLLGETCYVGWPHMVEALVTGVSDNTFKYTLDKHHPSSRHGKKNITHEMLTEKQLEVWTVQKKSVIESLKERRGIELGEVRVLVEACPIEGRRYICGQKGQVTLEKQWVPHPLPYPLQTVVKDIHVFESESNRKMETVEELFPIDCQCFMLANPHYGCSGKVLEVDMKQGRVRVQLTIPPEPDIASIMKKQNNLSSRYLPSYVLARKLGITSNLLARMTGKFFIERGSSTDAGDSGQEKIDIGLNLKYTKQNKEVLGYARRTDDGSWTYSPTAASTISEYLRKNCDQTIVHFTVPERFPELFEALASTTAERIFEDDILAQNSTSPTKSSNLGDVKDWLKTLPTHGLEAVTCGSTSLDEPMVEAIEEAVNQVKSSGRHPKLVKVRVRPYLLFRPHEHFGNIAPDPDADFLLFDRVVHVKMNTTVPFGMRGTIIGIHEGENDSVLYETVFDETFLGGQVLSKTGLLSCKCIGVAEGETDSLVAERCSSNKVYFMSPSSLVNITYGERMDARKRGAVVQPKSQTKPYATAASTGDAQPLMDVRIPFSPSIGASPDFTWNYRNSARGSPDVKLQSPGTPGVGRGKSPAQSPYGGGFGASSGRSPSSSTNVTPQGNQFRVSPNSAFTRNQQTTPITQIYGSPQSQSGSAHSRGSDKRQDVPPRFQKNEDKTPSRISNSEFANMWKELKSKEISPPESSLSAAESHTVEEKDVPGSYDGEPTDQTGSDEESHKMHETTKSPSALAQEGTQALRQLLQIGSKSSPTQQARNHTPQRRPVPQLQQHHQTEHPTHSPFGQPVSVEQLFGRQGPTKRSHVTSPPVSAPASGPYPSLILSNWCMAVGMPPPVFHYSSTNQGISALVQLANCLKFGGTVCIDRGEASESAAAVALSQMPRVLRQLAGPAGLLPISMFPGGQQFPPRPQHMSPHSPQGSVLHMSPHSPQGGVPHMNLHSPQGSAHHIRTHTPHVNIQRASGDSRSEFMPLHNRNQHPPSVRGTDPYKQPEQRNEEKSATPPSLFVPMQVTRKITSQSPGKTQVAATRKPGIETVRGSDIGLEKDTNKQPVPPKESGEEYLHGKQSEMNSAEVKLDGQSKSPPQKQAQPKHTAKKSSKRLLAPSFFQKT